MVNVIKTNELFPPMINLKTLRTYLVKVMFTCLVYFIFSLLASSVNASGANVDYFRLFFDDNIMEGGIHETQTKDS